MVALGCGKPNDSHPYFRFPLGKVVDSSHARTYVQRQNQCVSFARCEEVGVNWRDGEHDYLDRLLR